VLRHEKRVSKEADKNPDDDIPELRIVHPAG